MNELIRKYESAQRSHRHDGFHQIIIPFSGQLELDVEGRQGLVGARTIGSIVMGESHAFCANGDNRFLVLDVNDDQTLNSIWSRALDDPFLSMSQALVSLSDYALFCAQNGQLEKCMDAWQRLFLQTLACELENDLPELPKRIQKAITYMEGNLARDIQNSHLADVAALSPARFYEVFKNATGLSPQKYLMQRRLKTAQHLIKQGMALADVADEVGFADQGSFGRAFRNAFGQSPASWRKSEFASKKT